MSAPEMNAPNPKKLNLSEEFINNIIKAANDRENASTAAYYVTGTSSNANSWSIGPNNAPYNGQISTGTMTTWDQTSTISSVVTMLNARMDKIEAEMEALINELRFYREKSELLEALLAT